MMRKIIIIIIERSVNRMINIINEDFLVIALCLRVIYTLETIHYTTTA